MKPLTPCRSAVSRYLTAALLSFLVACQAPVEKSAVPPGASQGTHQGKAPAATATEISDQEYVTTLGLMAGHLLVAEELLNMGNVKGADPHIGHPLAELYADVAPRLEGQSQVPLQAELNRCQQLVDQSQAAPAVKACVAKSLELVDRAIALVPEQQRSQSAFQRQVLKQLLNTAAEEYDEAIADGRFAETVEYQDALGFVRFAQSLPLIQQNSDLATQLKQIAQAWPSVQPPAKPLVSAEQLRQQIKQMTTTSAKG